MDQFESERIENLKVQFYTIIGRLELEKQIVICYKKLQTFENVILKCESESEAAGCILGAIRRYTSILEHALPSQDLVPATTDSVFEETSEVVVELDHYSFLTETIKENASKFRRSYPTVIYNYI